MKRKPKTKAEIMADKIAWQWEAEQMDNVVRFDHSKFYTVRVQANRLRDQLAKQIQKQLDDSEDKE